MTGGLRQRTAETWLNLLFWHARHVPALTLAIKPIFAWGAWVFSRSIRRGTRANASRLLGEAAAPRVRDRVARATLSNFYDAVVEFGLNRDQTPAQLMQRLDGVVGEDRYLQVRQMQKAAAPNQSARGAILVTAHLGSFEVAMAMLREREPRVHVVFRRDSMPLFESLRTAQHAKFGVLEAPVDDGMPTWLRLRDALMTGDVVLMQGDRVMPGQPGIVVPFLGGHLKVPAGPVKLARMTGAPLIPVFAITVADRRLRIELGEPIWPSATSHDWSGSSIDPALIQLTAAIELVLKRHPEQWLRLDPALVEDQPTDV